MPDMPDGNSTFEVRGRSIEQWRVNAIELFMAAHMVWHGGTTKVPVNDGSDFTLITLHRPTRLLMGLSLEVLLKGLLIERDPTMINDGKFPRRLQTHKLERLFELAGILLEESDRELWLVRQLTDAVEWVSKYPIPTTAAELNDPKFGGGQLDGFNVGDLERFEALWHRIDIKFKSPRPASFFEIANRVQ